MSIGRQAFVNWLPAINLGLLVALCGVAIKVYNFAAEGINTVRSQQRKIDALLFEHALLIKWYCDEHGIKVEDLPTRLRGDPMKTWKGE